MNSLHALTGSIVPKVMYTSLTKIYEQLIYLSGGTIGVKYLNPDPMLPRNAIGANAMNRLILRSNDGISDNRMNICVVPIEYPIYDKEAS